MKIIKSDRKGKRYAAVFDNKTVHFGSDVGSTYIDHGNDETKKAWLARHRVRADWNDPYSAGALSRYILWGDSKSIKKNIELYKKRFSL